MNPLQVMIHDQVSPQELADYLDSLSHPSRLRLVTELKLRDQSKLYELVEGAFSLNLHHFVPEDTAPLQEVIHWGKNGLPAFTRFQKRFCRPRAEDQAGEVLWGYNHTPGLVNTAVGPGYFVARDGQPDTPVWIDYFLTPPHKPGHWPPIKPKTYRLSRFVYHQTIDRMRKVSHHVSVGAAYRKESALGAYFVLCREDKATARR